MGSILNSLKHLPQPHELGVGEGDPKPKTEVIAGARKGVVAGQTINV